MPFAEVRGARLFYTDYGSGDVTLIFVHGYTADCSDWIWQVPFFEKDYRVISVDQRGHGRSSAPPDGYETGSFAADLAGLIDHLGCGPVVAIGHSLGGLVVSTLAVEYPERVRAVVVVDPGYLLDPGTLEMLHGFTEKMKNDDPIELAQQLLGGLYTPASAPHLRKMHEIATSGTPPHVARAALFGDLGPEATYEYLVRRKCPVLAIYSSPTIDIDFSATTAEKRVEAEVGVRQHPASRVVLWKGTGHWLQQERYGEFNLLASEWISGVLAS